MRLDSNHHRPSFDHKLYSASSCWINVVVSMNMKTSVCMRHLQMYIFHFRALTAAITYGLFGIHSVHRMNEIIDWFLSASFTRQLIRQLCDSGAVLYSGGWSLFVGIGVAGSFLWFFRLYRITA
jgi:hypothetical protein